MLIIALTGGMGAGKSTAAAYFASRGAIVLNLDEMSARLLTPGSPLLDRVAAEFGEDVIGPDGALDRERLAAEAFVTPDSAARLNAIVHPALAREIGPALTSLRLLECPPSVVVLEVPLLVEAPVFAELADVVLAISAPESLRAARAVAGGLAPEDVFRRIARQATDEERADLADDVIENVAGKEDFIEQLERYWNQHVAATSLS